MEHQKMFLIRNNNGQYFSGDDFAGVFNWTIDMMYARFYDSQESALNHLLEKQPNIKTFDYKIHKLCFKQSEKGFNLYLD